MTYKNFSFFPVMKAAAAAKYGADGYLLLRNRTVCGVESSQMFPPTHEEEERFDFGPGFWAEEADPTIIEEWWEQVGDTYKAKKGDSTWQSVANPGWPLSVEHDGETFFLSVVERKYGLAFYHPDRGYPTLHARLTEDGVDVWDPAVLRGRPFPAILGRNYLEERTLADALTDEGVSVKVTELGGNIRRLEYSWQGQPHVAYEAVDSDADSWMSVSVVLTEPLVQDERELDWVDRLIREAVDPRYPNK